MKGYSYLDETTKPGGELFGCFRQVLINLSRILQSASLLRQCVDFNRRMIRPRETSARVVSAVPHGQSSQKQKTGDDALGAVLMITRTWIGSR